MRGGALLKGAALLGVLLAPLTAVAAPADNELAQLQSQVDRDALNYQSWFALGVKQSKLRNYPRAIEAFNKVSELRPDLAEPHNNLAVVYFQMGNFTAAARELDRSLEIKPGHAATESSLGAIYLRLAIDHIGRSLALRNDAQLRQQYERLLRVRDVQAEESRVAEAPAGEVAATTTSAEAASAKAPTVVDGDGAKVEQQVLQAVEQWRTAWSGRDIDAFLASYSDRFQPGGGQTLEQWRDHKRRVIGKSRKIEVRLEKVLVQPSRSGKRARVQLLQHYRSDALQSSGRKQLELELETTGWKIVGEGSL